MNYIKLWAFQNNKNFKTTTLIKQIYFFDSGGGRSLTRQDWGLQYVEE